MLLDNLPHRCTIRRRVRTKGSLGGSKDSYTNEQTDVECWEQPAGDSEITTYQQKGMNITHAVYFVTDPGVNSHNQILVTKRMGVVVASPVALDVMSAAAPDCSAGLGIQFKVMCNQSTAQDT